MSEWLKLAVCKTASKDAVVRIHLRTPLNGNIMSNLDNALTKGKEYISDMLSDFLYYNRKEDENFTLDDVKKMMNHPHAVEELTKTFEQELTRLLPQFK